MNFRIVYLSTIIILESCVKIPVDNEEYHDYIKFQFEECVIYLSNDSAIVLNSPDDYFYEVMDSRSGFIFQLSKNDDLIFSGQCVSTGLENHCNGSNCYFTTEFISLELDTFHLLYTGTLHLLEEFPYNESNLTYELSLIPENLEVVTIWNYYSYVE